MLFYCSHVYVSHIPNYPHVPCACACQACVRGKYVKYWIVQHLVFLPLVYIFMCVISMIEGSDLSDNQGRGWACHVFTQCVPDTWAENSSTNCQAGYMNLFLFVCPLSFNSSSIFFLIMIVLLAVDFCDYTACVYVCVCVCVCMCVCIDTSKSSLSVSFILRSNSPCC